MTTPFEHSNCSRRERLIRKLLLVDQSQARQNIWEKLDDSVLAVEALIETIELLKVNFLRFEGDPRPRAMTRSQENIARSFDIKKREAEAVLKQLRAMRGKAESTSSLVRFLIRSPTSIHVRLCGMDLCICTNINYSTLGSPRSKANRSPIRALTTAESRQR